MRFTKLICVWFVMSALAAGASDFFRLPEKDPGAGLPENRIYPLGRTIPILVYAPQSAENMKNGFTVAGPTYAKDKEKWAKQFTGLPVIYTVMARQNGVQCDKKFFAPGVKLDPAAIEADVIRTVTAALKKYPNIAFWYMVPEERRWWNKNEFEFLRIVYRAIRKADPSGRPVWMYLPGHYGAESVARYNDRMDVIGKGTYTNYSGFKNQRVWVRYSTEMMVAAARKSGRKMLALPVLEMMKAPEDDAELPKVSDWARHDVYCAMIAGAHGFSIFTLWNRPALRKAYKNYYKAYSRASKELSGKNGLGEIFLFGERCSDLKFAVTDGPAEIDLKLPKTVNRQKTFAMRKYPPVSLADIRHVRGRYAFLVNSANVPVKGALRGLPRERIEVRDAVSGKTVGTAEGGELPLAFGPLEVKLLKFENP